MREIKFLLAIWKTNLLSVMEFRIPFLTQVIGMMVNDFFYFLIWIIFFDQFKEVNGWGINDMYVTFGILASAVGLAELLFGNAFTLSEIINNGRLDYYLSLPRPVLLHTVSSRMLIVGLGDFCYGYLSYSFSDSFSWDGLLRFTLATVLAAVIFTAFLVSIQSLAFWMGMVSSLTNFVFNAVITFGIYPITLFDNYAKLILFTVIPAAFIGAIPAQFILGFSWRSLAELLGGAVVFLILAVFIFRLGLKRYESGSAIQLEV